MLLAEAHLARDLHDAAVADQLGDFDGGDVEGIGEGFADGDAAHESGAVIVGRVLLAVELESGGLVVDGGGGSDDGLNAIDGVVKSGGVDERLEDRAGLTMRERVIELALAVVAAADDRFDFAGARIERDEGDLGLREPVRCFPSSRLPFPSGRIFWRGACRRFFAPSSMALTAMRCERRDRAWCRRGNFR